MKALVFCSILGMTSLVMAQSPPASKPDTDSSAPSAKKGSASQNEPPRTDANDKKDKKEADSAATGDRANDRVEKSDAEWRKTLTREQYRVLRMKGTERPFTNKYDRHFESGTYVCAACGQELFASDTKFNSGCGWPAFYAAKAGDRVVLSPDLSMGVARTEVTCARCGSHLGHVFDDAPQTPTGQRFCINSVSLRFIPAKSSQADGESKADGDNKKAPDDKPLIDKPSDDGKKSKADGKKNVP